jgi:hypothetical protein
MRERAEKSWKGRMIKHKKYIRNGFLRLMVGSYFVIEERWPRMGGELTLDVSEHEDLYSNGLQASVNFGASTETMLVARTEQDREGAMGGCVTRT